MQMMTLEVLDTVVASLELLNPVQILLRQSVGLVPSLALVRYFTVY
jgi:hypothetical protein